MTERQNNYDPVAEGKRKIEETGTETINKLERELRKIKPRLSKAESFRQESLLLYGAVSSDFQLEAKCLYLSQTGRPNVRSIAHQYDCDIELREAKVRNNGPMISLDWKRRGIEPDGSSTAAVLVGYSKEKLEAAARHIHKTHGVRISEHEYVIINDKEATMHQPIDPQMPSRKEEIRQILH